MSGRAVLPNALSATRLLLAVYVLFCPPFIRLPLLLLAGLTDIVDGYLARRWHATSQIGAILDPIGDKGIALSFSYILWRAGALHWQGVAILFSRDITLIVFTLVLVIFGRWKQWRIRSFWCGKVATALQMLIFSTLCLGLSVPYVVYGALLFVALLAFPELLYRLYADSRSAVYIMHSKPEK